MRERDLPNNPEAEEAVLGGILLDPTLIDDVRELVETQDFYREGHRILYATMLELHANREPLDVVTVTQHLRTNGKLAAVGGAIAIAEVSEHVFSAANIRFHARLVRDHARARTVIEAAEMIAGEGYGAGTGDQLQEYIARTYQRLQEVTLDHGAPAFVSAADAALEVYQGLSSPALRILSTGFSSFDKSIGGMPRGRLTVLAGRPGYGKTTVATALAMATLDEGGGVLQDTLEVDRAEILLREVSNRMSIPNRVAQNRWFHERQFSQVRLVLDELAKLPWFIGDKPLPWPQRLASYERMLRRHPEVVLLIVDHVGLIRGVQGFRPSDRHLIIGEITASLAELAKRANIAVLLCSHLNREVEKEKRRPRLADLRESGSLENDASLVLFLHMPEPSHGDTEADLELIVAKNRNGPTGVVLLKYWKQFCRIWDPAVPMGEYTPEPLPQEEPDDVQRGWYPNG